MELFVLISETGCGDSQCCGDFDHEVQGVTDDIEIAKMWHSKGSRHSYEKFTLNERYNKPIMEALNIKDKSES